MIFGQRDQQPMITPKDYTFPFCYFIGITRERLTLLAQLVKFDETCDKVPQQEMHDFRLVLSYCRRAWNQWTFRRIEIGYSSWL